MNINLEELAISDRNRRRKMRRLIIELLPKDWFIRRKVKAASLAVEKSYNAFDSKKDRFDHLICQTTRQMNKSYDAYSDLLSSFVATCGIPMINRSIATEAKKMGVETETLERVFEVLQKVSDEHVPLKTPKRTSKNKKTDKRYHDIEVGRVLMDRGVSRRLAATILAELRSKDPYIGCYSEMECSIIIDKEKEMRSIEQALRNEGL